MTRDAWRDGYRHCMDDLTCIWCGETFPVWPDDSIACPGPTRDRALREHIAAEIEALMAPLGSRRASQSYNHGIEAAAALVRGDA